jgi:hypothetical protein
LIESRGIIVINDTVEFEGEHPFPEGLTYAEMEGIVERVNNLLSGVQFKSAQDAIDAVELNMQAEIQLVLREKQGQPVYHA